MDTLSLLSKKGVSRRNFLTGAGAIGAASVLAGCANDGTIGINVPSTRTTITDPDILNFALNLEYLEANFFLYSATGAGLATADQGTGAGTVTGGSKVAGLTSQQEDTINEIAYAEQQHVRFLQAGLTANGAAYISMPNIDLVNSFSALATAAGISGGFNPYANYDSWLVGAFVFEDVGVTAYSGAAPLISAAGVAAGLLNDAAGIQAVEAYHAGFIRTELTARAIAAAAAGTAYPYLGYANQISTLRATLGGGNETQLTLPTSTSTPSSIAAASPSTAIGYSRTLDQVLHIVYGTGGGAGVAKGGFFPSGINGAYTVTQS